MKKYNLLKKSIITIFFNVYILLQNTVHCKKQRHRGYIHCKVYVKGKIHSRLRLNQCSIWFESEFRLFSNPDN